MFSRMISEVRWADPWSPMVTSDSVFLFVPDKLCTLMPLNTHLFVEVRARTENTGTTPGMGAAWIVTKSGLTTSLAKEPIIMSP